MELVSLYIHINFNKLFRVEFFVKTYLININSLLSFRFWKGNKKFIFSSLQFKLAVGVNVEIQPHVTKYVRERTTEKKCKTAVTIIIMRYLSFDGGKVFCAPGDRRSDLFLCTLIGSTFFPLLYSWKFILKRSLTISDKDDNVDELERRQLEL